MKFRLAVTEWMPGYQSSWLGTDLTSGAAVWAVLVPTALAYASLVGVDALVGLYTIPAALLAYAILGGSRLLVVGPDAAVAVLSGATIAVLAANDPVQTLNLAMTLAVMVGALYILFSLFRLAWVSDLIPDPVLKGVVEGIVWVTILKQMSKLFGLHVDGSLTFFPKLLETVQMLPQAHFATAVIGLATFAALFLMNHFLPRLPSSLIVLVISIILVGLFDLASEGVAVLGATGEARAGGELSVWPGLKTVIDLLPGALAVMILGSTLTLAASKRSAEKTGEPIDPDREFLAVGAANIGSGLSTGYPVAGTLSKTAVAMQAGGKTQVGNIFAGVLTVLTILFLVPFFANLADAALAALVIVVMLEVSDLKYFRTLWQVRRLECAVAIAAFLGVLGYGTLPGVVIGVALALFLLADHIRRPPTSMIGRTPGGVFAPEHEQEEAVEIPGLMIWRHYGPLVFLNARRLANDLRQRILERDNVRVVVIDAVAISAVDATATKAFIAAMEDLSKDDIELWVSNIHPDSWRRVVAAMEDAGSKVPRTFDSLDAVYTAFQAIEAASTEADVQSTS